MVLSMSIRITRVRGESKDAVKSAQRHARRQVTQPKAHRLVVLIYAALGIVRRPAGDVLKQANSADAPLAAEVEPMAGSARHAAEIARLDRDGDNPALP